MKRKNLKRTLAMVSALALSAQLILPTAIFAESESDTTSPAERPGMTARAEEKDFKDDIIFIGSSDTGEDADKTLIKCISFGMHGGKEMKFGMSDKEPPEKPDGTIETNRKSDSEPPEKPENDLKQTPDIELPEKPNSNGKEMQKPDGEPPAKPESNGESIQTPDGEPPEKPDDEKFKETSIEISKGDTISITKSDGTVLETVTADKNAKGVVFSSDALVQNETYTLLINGEAAAAAELLERINNENGDKNNADFQKPFDQSFEKGKNNADGRNDMPPLDMDRQDMSLMNRNSDMHRIQR